MLVACRGNVHHQRWNPEQRGIASRIALLPYASLTFSHWGNAMGPARRRSSSRARWLGWLYRALVLLLVLLLGWGSPAVGEPTPSAAVQLDGRSLFQIWPSSSLSAEQRSSTINERLHRAVELGQPITVEVQQSNNLPVLSLNGSTLLTITERDVQEGLTSSEQAALWRRVLERALLTARQERRPEHLKAMLPLVVSLLLTALALTWILHRLCLRFFPQAWRPAANLGDRHARNGRFLVRSTLAVLQGAVWLGVTAAIGNLFPASRRFGAWVLHATTGWLDAPFLPLGERSYSLLDAVILLSLFVLLTQAVGLLQRLLRRRVLRHTGMSLGGQEAVAFVARYGLLFIGTLVLLQLWGLDLTSLALFASVLGVGVGLGLQGISKNVLSGLIIIFERPIQVGDFVEIGDLQGTVLRLGLRCTEVVTLDRISIIVPNSDFLESRVVNWSHGSPISRLRVPVGVAYGSDTTAVRDALMASCRGQTAILRDPPPQVFFSGFGDSALNFTLMVWIRDPIHQYDIISDLNYRIEAILRQKEITVPFPQRDLHLRHGDLRISLPPTLEAGLQALVDQHTPPTSPER